MASAVTTLQDYKPRAENPIAMSAWLVTVKINPHPDHDPQNKQAGLCPVTMKTCTDITGAHHTMMVIGSTVMAVRNQVQSLGFHHITRIEEV